MARLVKWSPPFRGEDVERPAYDLIDYEKDPPIGRIVLNSPEKRNPLGYERLLQVAMAAKDMELDEDIKVIIIKGQGPSFCAGYDITPIQPGQQPRNMPANGYVHPDRDPIWQSYDHEHMRVFFTLWDLQKPVIAQIHGYCLAGGTELAAFCDLRVVAEDAQIGWPVGRNWSPGNVQYMPWMCGITKAKFYMFTNQPMDGVEAYRCGWASAVFPAEQLEEKTEEIAHQISLTDTDLIMLTKRSINRQFEIMGFRTGCASSAEFIALGSLRPSRARQGDTFQQMAREKGLKAALDWRDRALGVSYRTSLRPDEESPGRPEAQPASGDGGEEGAGSRWEETP
jgi:enoyl-CoA hydratase